ncbi:MAG: efflux RND transporter permease subunit, partial [Elusimicrobiota bacterium]|nr:efflux RND transporter permease subunit [Elusimicrobiota bacterium]
MSATYLLHLLIFGVLIIALASQLPKFSINRPVTYTVILFSIFLAGFVCIKNMPLELMPDISYGNVTIFIDVRGGMPPNDVERLITKPVEESMSTISNMKNIVSISKKQRSVTTIEFEAGINMDMATLEVREKFLKVKPKLPKEIESPIIAHYEENDAPVVIVAFMSQDKTPEELRAILEYDLKEKLLKSAGVANVEIGGGRQRKILVEIDKNKMNSLGLSINTIISVIEKSNISMQVGDITRDTLSYTIRTLNGFRSIEEIENIGIAIDKNSSYTTNSLIKIKDFATVKDFYLEAESYSRLNSKSAVTLYIQKESLSNTVDVARKVKIILDEFGGTLDEGTQMLIISDQSKAILSALHSVQMTIFYGAVLVILVLSLFLSRTELTKNIIRFLLALLIINLAIFYCLGISLDSSRGIVLIVLLVLILVGFFWRRDIMLSFVVAFSIPVSLFMTIIFMYLENFSLNVITLSGLVLGIGLLVDNSIVVLENFDSIRKKDKVLSFSNQIEMAAEQMANPMIGGTLTTIVVFLPFFLLQKQAQLLYSGIAFTVITSLLASLFAALSLVPFLTSKFIRFENAETKSKILKRIEIKLDRFIYFSRKNFTKLKEFLARKMSRVFTTKNLLILFSIFIIIFCFKFGKKIDTRLFMIAVIGVLSFGIYKFKDLAKSLGWMMNKSYIVVSVVLILFIVSVFIFVFRLPKDFMASREENEFIVFVELSSGVKLDICDEIVKQVE